MTRTTTYNNVLDAAEAIVRRDGSASLTLDSVAAEAGAGRADLLQHFPDREALLAAMAERMLATFEDAHQRAIAFDPAEPGCWTRAYVRSTFDPEGPVEQERTSSALLVSIATTPALLDALRGRYVEWRKRAAGDGLPGEDAMIVALAADGLWVADLLGFAAPQGEQRRRIISRMLEMAGRAPSSIA